jgi:hypothetical protein
MLIVFSVLLALSLDGWRQSAAEQRRLQEALGSLADELKFNRELLGHPRYRAYHQELFNHYRDIANRGSIDGADKAFESGLRIAPLRDTAWTSFAQSNIANLLPFDLRADLAGVYRDQNATDELFRSMVGGLIAPRADRELPAFQRDQIRVLTMFLADLVVLEGRLLERYPVVESRLRERGPRP